MSALVPKMNEQNWQQAQQQLAELTKENEKLQRQLDWFKRQLFGRKSEKRLIDSPLQASFSELFPEQESKASQIDNTVTIAAHQRKKKTLAGTPEDSGLRFDEKQVPVKEIEVPVVELTGPNADQYEIIRYEHTYRLAQRQGSYEVLKYKRPVLKHKETQTLTTPPAPESPFGKSFADVSFVVGMMIEKFTYHLPLYRQHLRLKASYIEVSRSTLTNLVEKAALLLEPIAKAVLASILESTLIAMDETPTKAGRSKQKGAKRGQMKVGWYWPLYGDSNEVYFHFSSSRGSEVVKQLLAGFNGTLLSDGYSAYEHFCKSEQNVSHAQCWVHTRRYFEKALDNDPELANQGMDYIAALYSHERVIKEKSLQDTEKIAYRREHQLNIVNQFFNWCKTLVNRSDLIAEESPMIDAARYSLNREEGLRVFLGHSDVPLDTNHVEQTLRVIPCGRKNWMFNWTELGAHYVGVIQTLLSTCKLQGVDPYVYLIDVLQRVDRHPASKVHELTPKNWKVLFAEQPIGSDLA